MTDRATAEVTTTIELPDLSLVVLVGASSAGKSTFARKHFAPTEIVSSDHCRALVSDDETDQSVSAEAFALLHHLVETRLRLGRLTVVDATSLKREDRQRLLAIAKQCDVLPVMIAFDPPIRTLIDRNANRTDRQLPGHVIERQHKRLSRETRSLGKERWNRRWTLRSSEEAEQVQVTRTRLWTDRRDDHGPFDIIGDIHGCYAETIGLLDKLGWETGGWTANATAPTHPDGRRAIFLGDLVDRGPDSPAVVELVMAMVAAETALCVLGNHEQKLVRALDGRKVKRSHGLAETLVQLETRSDEFTQAARDFADGLISHYVLDDGRLVVAHAGLPEAFHNRSSGRVRSFALYGDTTGETDEFGLPVRYPWANDYSGDAAVVYGHTPVPTAEWLNNTICLDTGCVFGGSLTALRWPERELVQIGAEREYYAPARPTGYVAGDSSATPATSTLLAASDVLGKHSISTELMHRVTIDADQSATAIEVMSRFAADPRWLVYLPPTMAPSPTSKLDGYLEHPADAFDAYRKAGVSNIVCQEKHMGSRAVITLARSVDAAAARFSISNDAGGLVMTRTGRPFFAHDKGEWNRAVIERMRSNLDHAGWWDEFATDWFVFDCELLPWSAKAGRLIDLQYSPAGTAAAAHLARASEILATASQRLPELSELMERSTERGEHVAGYQAAWQRYCWPVNSASDLSIAPFQILAAEGEVLARRSHRWHLDQIDQLIAAGANNSGPALVRTDRIYVDTTDEAERAAATDWWLTLTETGGEGMVAKPVDTIVVGDKGLVLPGMKCRGRDYLRMVYGPEYLSGANLDRLRDRSIGRKASLARREFALGIEAMDRFVTRQHPSKVHECVFGVLALESEPVDPRL